MVLFYYSDLNLLGRRNSVFVTRIGRFLRAPGFNASSRKVWAQSTRSRCRVLAWRAKTASLTLDGALDYSQGKAWGGRRPRSKKNSVADVGTRSFSLWVIVSLAFHAFAMTTWVRPVQEPVSDVAKPSFVVTFASLPVGPVGKLAPVAKHDSLAPDELNPTPSSQPMRQPAGAATRGLRGEDPTAVLTSASGGSSAPTDVADKSRELEAALAEFDRDQAELNQALSALANGQTMVASTTPNANQVRTRLVADLNRFINPYPSVAKGHAWEGQVVLGVTVETDGRLSDIRILRSSGNSVLDRHAVDSLRKVQQFHVASGWRLPASLPLELPVTYDLTNI